MADRTPDKPKTDEKPEGTESKLDAEMVKWTRAVAKFTGLLVAANVIALFFIWQQWRVASNAQTDTRAQLRAVVGFIGVGQTIVNNKEGAPAFYSIVPAFQNYGGTRTERFSGWVNIHFFEGGVPANLDLTKQFEKVEAADTIIGPNSPYQMQAVTFTADQVQRAARNEGVLLLWGQAEWSDIFDPNVIHPISMCLQFTPTSATTGQMILLPSPYRNDCHKNK